MNQITQQTIQVGELANGQALTIPVFTVGDTQAGPNVYIQANMHGAEVQGNAVIYALLEKLKSARLAGSITLVPYANPIGCNQKSGEFTLGRFDPITGENWNRLYHDHSHLIAEFATRFKDEPEEIIRAEFKQLLIEQTERLLTGPLHQLKTGKRIALHLQHLAHQADLVLDLHTGPVSAKHLYCPEYAKDSAKHFDIPHTLLIPNEFDGAMDEACFCPWWQLSEAFAAQGREFSTLVEAFTVELGSQEHIDLKEADNDANSILSYLTHKEVILESGYRPQPITRYACYLKDYVAVYAPMGGMIDYQASLGAHVKAGDSLATVLRMDKYCDGEALQPITFAQDGIAILHFASASVNQGTELYKLFTNYFEL
ncbi:succinylglutamate desuccinylase/aspartoacylase family protein [Pseudoalteromonas luteoviolacea]|uniref:succinylglutamate desuccinylase/aspartoacylase family protein n=1 Tax=Pseudoalteromonas luteoviolacea TaxID=43657 RepID=UPI001B36E075|nr:succinylglutamate desuccinylase/aspartoacylase family protein [Pseudoalteromonas luteoviolacea]MBQ4813421.1 succinylglutamate desuccinylase/aspartoacylase family protein [Pseudoalteromonas luteoviolacea]